MDNVRRDKDNFMTFPVRRLPQRIPAKLILVFVSNRLDWPEHLDPRVKSFRKLNEIVFTPYLALDAYSGDTVKGISAAVQSTAGGTMVPCGPQYALDESATRRVTVRIRWSARHTYLPVLFFPSKGHGMSPGLARSIWGFSPCLP